MYYRNMVLQEAMNDPDNVKIDNTCKTIKKALTQCKFLKYAHKPTNLEFYTMFFTQSLPDKTDLTFEQWSTVYTQLLSQDQFCSELATLCVCWMPVVTSGLFSPLWNLVEIELGEKKENRIQYLATVKAFFSMLSLRFEAIANLIKLQVHDVNALKFIGLINQTILQMYFDTNKLMEEELSNSIKPDDVNVISAILSDPRHITESADTIDVDKFELVTEEGNDLYNLIDTLITESAVNETVIDNVKQRAKQAFVAKNKAENQFDTSIMRWVKSVRENRQNRKHAELCGEALRVNHKIKQLLRSGAIYLINPAWGALSFIIQIIYDRKTDKKDRAILVGQLRDELEIIEEKIQMAERNGDDKAKIDLIRFKQKINRELTRITNARFTQANQYRMGIGNYAGM